MCPPNTNSPHIYLHLHFPFQTNRLSTSHSILYPIPHHLESRSLAPEPPSRFPQNRRNPQAFKNQKRTKKCSSPIQSTLSNRNQKIQQKPLYFLSLIPPNGTNAVSLSLSLSIAQLSPSDFFFLNFFFFFAPIPLVI